MGRQKEAIEKASYLEMQTLALTPFTFVFSVNEYCIKKVENNNSSKQENNQAQTSVSNTEKLPPINLTKKENERSNSSP